MEIKIKKLHTFDIPLPAYMSDNAAGMDLCAALADDETIYPQERKIIATGIAIALPAGYEAQIRPRSGLALKHGITILNAPGTIDADYRGEIKIILINLGSEPYVIHRGDRVAQMIVQPVPRVVWEEVGELDATVRADGGFGHTGDN